MTAVHAQELTLCHETSCKGVVIYRARFAGTEWSYVDRTVLHTTEFVDQLFFSELPSSTHANNRNSYARKVTVTAERK